MTASDSSLSGTAQTDRLQVDLLASGLLPPLPAAFLSGEALDLLAPLGFSPGDLESPGSAGVDRRSLAAALATANASYGHPAGGRLATQLADPATRVVVTGQQPGLFGGPLYTLTKAVAATLWAERLQTSGVPAVAVFWVATEDHDYREVAQGRFPTASGVLSVDLGDDPSPLLPVGMRTFGQSVTKILEELKGAMPGERYTEWVEKLGTWYRPEARFGEAFCRLLVEILKDRCPLLLDSMLPAVKLAQQPWLERLASEREDVEQAFIARDRAIESRGFELQVSPQRGASPLFVLHGRERRRIEWLDADRFALRGREPFEESIDWLLELIAENPAAVSAGVMGRSALQDAILGTTVLLLGPGEVSYMPQVAPVYDVLGISPPSVAIRPQAMVLSRHQAERFETLDVTLADLLSSSFDIDGFLARGKGDDVVAPVREAIRDQLVRLKGAALGIDGDLAKPWEKTQQQVDKALAAFSGRLTATVARRDEIARSRLEDLLASSRPAGALQERIISTAHFPGKFGSAFSDALFSQLDLDPARLHLIIPGETS
ncbi:MAG: bacillithiol biosynthesis cysteine-adding enzyme BshC [Acidobacteriota bacterium]|nr:bacillithiol biosynthesis cysteine-adding enzyme BshC [Acidobacteriota bacterium]